jgi:hypothetical protein
LTTTSVVTTSTGGVLLPKTTTSGISLPQLQEHQLLNYGIHSSQQTYICRSRSLPWRRHGRAWSAGTTTPTDPNNDKGHRFSNACTSRVVAGWTTGARRRRTAGRGAPTKSWPVWTPSTGCWRSSACCLRADMIIGCEETADVLHVGGHLQRAVKDSRRGSRTRNNPTPTATMHSLSKVFCC